MESAQFFNDMLCQAFNNLSIAGYRLVYFSVWILMPVMVPAMANQYASGAFKLFD
jgi:hypothetical protein